MERKLQRNTYDKAIAGVASGLADYFDVEVSWVRLAFILAFLLGFSGFLAYIILWILLPARPYPVQHINAEYRVDRPAVNNTSKSNSRLFLGLLLVLLGVYFLSDEFDFIPYWLTLDKLWPAVLIIIGVLILTKTAKKNDQYPKNDTDWDRRQNDAHSGNSNTDPL